MFAVLGDKTLKSVIDVDGQNLDVKANFTKETIAKAKETIVKVQETIGKA